MDTRTFFFDADGRLRSGWRLAIFCVIFVPTAMFLASFAAALFYPSGFTLGPAKPTYLVINGLIMLAASLGVGWFCGKYLEGLPFRALGATLSRGWARNLLLGLAVGTASLLLAVLIAIAFGGLRFEWNSVSSSLIARSLAVSFLIFAVGAAWEEALFRGYILQTFARSGLAWVGIAITALFFGATHTLNPNPTVISTIDTMLAGIWFGVAYLKTRDLWFVWGMHLIWNWLQGAVFGIEVSGLTYLVSHPLLKEIDHGPEWLTGASYGIEGSIASTIALIVSTVVIYFLPLESKK